MGAQKNKNAGKKAAPKADVVVVKADTNKDATKAPTANNANITAPKTNGNKKNNNAPKDTKKEAPKAPAVANVVVKAAGKKKNKKSQKKKKNKKDNKPAAKTVPESKTEESAAAKGGKRPRADEDAVTEEPFVPLSKGRVVVSLSSAWSNRKAPVKPVAPRRVDEVVLDEATTQKYGAIPKVMKALVAYSTHAKKGKIAAGIAKATAGEAFHAPNDVPFAWTTPGKIGTSTRNRIDRYNFPGCGEINEFVLKNRAGAKLVPGQLTRSNHRVVTPLTARKGAVAPGAMVSVKVPKAPSLLDRSQWNLVKSFVHPLHNFLQQQEALHNEDELQVLMLPAEDEYGVKSKKQNTGGRVVFVATNQESLTQEGLEKATAGWGVLSTLRITSMSVIHGEKGRHAEQKLIDFYMSTYKKKDWANVLRNCKRLEGQEKRGEKKDAAEVSETPEAASVEDDHYLPFVAFEGVTSGTDSAIIVGERLPCVACRLYAAVTGVDKHVAILPTHGHLYLATFEHTPACVTTLSPHAALEVLNGGI